MRAEAGSEERRKPLGKKRRRPIFQSILLNLGCFQLSTLKSDEKDGLQALQPHGPLPIGAIIVPFEGQ